MFALLLAALSSCPLLNGGVMVTWNAVQSHFEYRVYIQNPTPFRLQVSNVELVVRDPDKAEYHSQTVWVRNVSIDGKAQESFLVEPYPPLNPTFIVGSYTNCNWNAAK